MPKLKPPIPLLKMSMDVLRELLFKRCKFIVAAGGSVEDVRRLIEVFRDKICTCMPGYLLADFCHKFLDEFHSGRGLVFHRHAALEIIMDIEIHGLRFEDPMTRYIVPWDAHRIRELSALNMVRNYWAPDHDTTGILELFHLTELTFFKQRNCTDADLEIIGRKCPKLKILCISDSNRVTDIGLRNLNRCSSLRYVDISNCNVSHKGLSDLLLTNSTIDTLAYSDENSRFAIRNVLSLFLLDPFIYPSMKSLVIRSTVEFTSAQLNRVVIKFPNLTSIKIYSVLTGDLDALKSLDNLTIIDLSFPFFAETVPRSPLITWNNMEQLLRLNGISPP